MSTMTCKLFGVPQILKDGQPVFLPYSKINALLYYILVSKVVSREELAGLLWPDETDETARRNLRNAIYQAKKALGTNIILSPKKPVSAGAPRESASVHRRVSPGVLPERGRDV